MIIFFAEVAASSFPYAVRYLIPLTTSITNDKLATNPTIPFVQVGRTFPVIHALIPPPSA